MQIIRERMNEKLTIKLSGRLETTTAPDLQKLVDHELEGITELNVDIKELKYISSAGLRVLLAATKRMKAKRGITTIYNANEDVMEVFEITGFKEILNIQ
ncbi:MAG: STAS domain-containing protein [Lachnospiraceae bacterium]